MTLSAARPCSLQWGIRRISPPDCPSRACGTRVRFRLLLVRRKAFAPHKAFIESHLQQSRARHAGLLQTLPAIHDAQISWLLLWLLRSPAVAVCAIRSLPPTARSAFATAHDDTVLACLDTLLSSRAPSGQPLLASARAPLALLVRNGGWRVRSAARHAPCTDRLLVFLGRCAACHSLSVARALVEVLRGSRQRQRSYRRSSSLVRPRRHLGLRFHPGPSC